MSRRTRDVMVAGTGRATMRGRGRARGARVVGAVVLGACAVGATGGGVSAGASVASRTVAAPGGRWSAVVTLFRGQGALLPSISCASARQCVAVGANGSSGVAVSGATSWSPPVAINKFGGLAGVSCAAGGSCVAVGASELLGLKGVTYRLVGGKWSAGPTSAFDLFAVSCATASFCGAVDDLSPHGHGYVYNGKSWSAATAIGVSADSISCPTTSFCVAVSQSGKLVYYDHGTWTKAVSIDPSGTRIRSRARA